MYNGQITHTQVIKHLGAEDGGKISKSQEDKGNREIY